MNIVISGASRGIGYQTALFFTRKGHEVFALSRNEAGLKKLLEESGGRIHTIVCDLSSESSVQTAVRKISEKVSSVEVLINNAGLLVKKGLAELTMQDWKDVYGVNVFGAFVLTRELLQLLRAGSLQSGGVHSHVVNLSSMGGVQGSVKFAGLSAYSSSKGALITMTECFAEELSQEGIRVNAVALGSVDTEMFAQAFPGLKAGTATVEASEWLGQFSAEGWRFFNGKTLQMTATTP